MQIVTLCRVRVLGTYSVVANALPRPDNLEDGRKEGKEGGEGSSQSDG